MSTPEEVGEVSEAQTPFETAQCYAPPTVTQFSVFLDNRVGKLHDLVEAFGDSTSQICALSVHDASDCAIVRLITNQTKVARHILREHRLAFAENEVLIVELTGGKTAREPVPVLARR